MKLFNVIDSQYFIMGPTLQNWKRKFVNISDAKKLLEFLPDRCALAGINGSRYSTWRRSDRSDIFFFATAGVVARLNAVSVFVDCDPITFNIDHKKIEENYIEKKQ